VSQETCHGFAGPSVGREAAGIKDMYIFSILEYTMDDD